MSAKIHPQGVLIPIDDCGGVGFGYIPDSVSNSQIFGARPEIILTVMYEHIKNNNHIEVQRIFSNLDNVMQGELLNGTEETGLRQKTSKLEQLLGYFKKDKRALQKESRPLFQAVMFGSFDVVQTLRDLGANVLQQEKHGWNIIHYLILVSYHNEEYESKAVCIYKKLLCMLSTTEIKELLMTEDNSGLRPLELAANACCLSLLKAIFNTKNVYVAKIERKGLEEKTWFDVSEYESNFKCHGRTSKSPIYLLTFSDRKVLKSPKALKILRCRLLRLWARNKLICNIPFLCLWFLFRLSTFLIFYCFLAVDFLNLYQRMKYGNEYYSFLNQTYFNADDNYTSDVRPKELPNGTQNGIANETCERFQSWYRYDDIADAFYALIPVLYVMAGTFASMAFDVVTFIISLFTRPNRWSNVFGHRKSLIIYTLFYRLCHFVFMGTAFDYTMFAFMRAADGQRFEGSNMAKSFLLTTCYLSVWSLLYFVQLLPAVGHFVNIVQRMQSIMLSFTLVFAIMSYPYPHAFMNLLKKDGDCQVHGFENLMEGVYSTFKVMINSLDFHEYNANGKV